MVVVSFGLVCPFDTFLSFFSHDLSLQNRENAAAFYFGGSIYYNDDGILEYNAGRDLGNRRSTCLVNKCGGSGCGSYCRPWEQGWLKITNTKVFLAAGIGFGSWSGRLEVLGYECHDCGLSMMALSDGFWATNMLSVCRTNDPIALPEKASASRLRADGFRWYDTGQEHIITNATFRNCGYRSDEYNQYEKSRNRGCGDDDSVGCLATSSVWSFLTHSDQHVPEMMQATRSIEFENCGRRFRHRDFRRDRPSSVSGREQNWLDTDGSITGFRESSIVASGLADAGMWWQVDDEGMYAFIVLGCNYLRSQSTYSHLMLQSFTTNRVHFGSSSLQEGHNGVLVTSK